MERFQGQQIKRVPGERQLHTQECLERRKWDDISKRDKGRNKEDEKKEKEIGGGEKKAPWGKREQQ